jgi:hypothetical protein
MTKKKFSIIEGKSYRDIQEILGINRQIFAPWWEELKEESWEGC